jgi:FAD:protein FMN transferase
MARIDFKGIGTAWAIDIYDLVTAERLASLKQRILTRIDEFDKAYSRFRADSIVTAIASKAGDYPFPGDARKLFSVYRDLYSLTDGYFTPLVGQLLVDAGYDAHYSLKPKAVLSIPPKWDEVMECIIGADAVSPILQIRKPVQLDFGAAGKGYIIDLIGALIEADGIASYCINAGGDILYKGTKPIRIGLENPTDTDQIIGICHLHDGSICGSAGNRRRWGDFTHIMDPKALSSPVNILAIWVVADSALIADALTTCLFFVRPEALTPAYRFEYVILYPDHSFEKSSGFPGELCIA